LVDDLRSAGDFAAGLPGTLVKRPVAEVDDRLQSGQLDDLVTAAEATDHVVEGARRGDRRAMLSQIDTQIAGTRAQVVDKIFAR
jgi:hypothetical protein